MHAKRPDVTILLSAVAAGEENAVRALFEQVYEEVRQMAAHQMDRERPGHTLQATALAHEAYVRLLDHQNPKWADRRYFFASVGQAMRRILIEHARRHKRQVQLVSGVGLVDDASNQGAVDWEALDRALEELSAEDQRLVEVVHLRYYAGLSRADTAAALGVSEATVKRDWAYARARLLQILGCGD